MAQTTYRFSVGPWNISEGRDPYGPETRPPRDFVWKLERFKDGGFDAVMFHDDDVVPDLDELSAQEVLARAREVRRQVDDAGLAVEMVAPRLWFSPHTVDGAYTSNDPRARKYAIERSLQAIDIADVMGCDLIVWWLARDGTYLRESKSYQRSLEYLVEAADRMLAHPPRHSHRDRAEAERAGRRRVPADDRPRARVRAPHQRPGPRRRARRDRALYARRLDPADEMEFALHVGQALVSFT